MESPMSENPTEQEAKDQAVQYVVDDAKSSWTGSPPETVKENIEEGLQEAQVDVPGDEVEQLAQTIHEGRDPDTAGLAE